MNGRFEILLDRFLGGEATREEQAELETLLRGDAAKRRRLAERLLLEVHLYKAFAGIAPVQRAPISLARFQRFVPAAWAAAVLLLALSAWLIFYAYPGRRGGTQGVVESGQVRAGNATIAHIAPEVPFAVAGPDVAVIRLPDGTRAELDPGSQAIVHAQAGAARPTVELLQGGGKFEVPPGQGQFRVDTPLGTVTVLGTVFAVRLQQAASLQVAVVSGKVQVQCAGKLRMLTAGESGSFPESNDKPNRVAEPAKNDELPENIVGVLREIDAARSRINVTMVDQGEVAERILKVASDAPVIVNGIVVRLADLRVGKQVHLRLSDDRRLVLLIQQEVAKHEDPGPANPGPLKDDPTEIAGILKTVQAIKNSITVTTVAQGQAVDETFGLAGDLEVLVNGKAGDFGDLKPGMEVRLKLSDDRKFVTELIGVRKRIDDNDSKKHDGQEVRGLLKAVDLGKHTITILGKIKGKDIDLKYALKKDVSVAWQGQPIELKALIPGMQVHVRLAENLKVIDIRVDSKKFK